mgnify:CR=1 FL=1
MLKVAQILLHIFTSTIILFLIIDVMIQDQGFESNAIFVAIAFFLLPTNFPLPLPFPLPKAIFGWRYPKIKFWQ